MNKASGDGKDQRQSQYWRYEHIITPMAPISLSRVNQMQRRQNESLSAYIAENIQPFQLQIMFPLFLLALLAAVNTSDSPVIQSPYRITPPLPPTTYVGQHFTIQFRVIGMIQPTFVIEGLPSQLTATSHGLVQGVPIKTGSFLLTITAKQGENTTRTQTVLRVSSPANSPQNSALINQLTARLHMNDHARPLTYEIGQEISLQLTASVGEPPYIFTYLRLPSELQADDSGFIRGYFQYTGYYSFGVSVADATGHSAEQFYTLNIQPILFGKQQFRDLSDREMNLVSVRQPFSDEQVQRVQKIQQQTWDEVVQLSQLVSQSRKKVYVCQQIERELLGRLKQQSKQFMNKQLLMRSELKQAKKVINMVNTNAEVYQQALKFYKLTQTALILTSSLVDQARQQTQIRNQEKQKLSQFLNRSNVAYSNAQKSTSSAQSKLNSISFNKTQAELNVNLTHQVFQKYRSKAQNALLQQIQADTAADMAQMLLERAQMANDQALKRHNEIVEATKKAEKVIDMSNALIKTIKNTHKRVEEDLGIAKFNLNQAENRLFVAQAAKQQAQKAVMLTMVTTLEPLQRQANHLFSGCGQNAFPSAFGSGVLKETLSSGWRLASGHVLLYGQCSQLSQVKEGDLVEYDGYMREGAIHVITLRKHP